MHNIGDRKDKDFVASDLDNLCALQLLFPAVTFCNHNRIKCGRLDHELKKADSTSSANETKKILEELWNQACVDLSPTTQGRTKRQSGPSDSNMLGAPHGDTPSYLESEYEFLAPFMTLSENERRSIGHDFDSFIKACTFRGKDCLNIRLSLHLTSALIY